MTAFDNQKPHNINNAAPSLARRYHPTLRDKQYSTSLSSTLITRSYIISGRLKGPASTPAVQECLSSELPFASILDYLLCQGRPKSD
jgi:hypothetical protein